MAEPAGARPAADPRDEPVAAPEPPRWRVPAVGALRVLGARAVAVGSSLQLTFEREMEHGRGFLWLSVLFALGIAGYFALPREPNLIALPACTILAAAVAWARRHATASFRVAVCVAAVFAGLTAAKVRTDSVTAPAFPGERTVGLTGWIASEEEAPNGGRRLVVRVIGMEGIDARDMPVNVQVTVRARAENLAVGQAIALKARLSPPSGPALPGGYDFSFAPFYGRIGAIGFAYGTASPIAAAPAPLAIRLTAPLDRLRDRIRARVESALPGDYGHIAAALIMGDQRVIADDTQDNMRASGLGHILSISGLHLALVAGSVFWLIRALLALSPTLALRYPIKKWAAAAALAVATVYLGISGAEVATIRSWVMLVIMLGAVLLDRRALTLRNVALAALLILVVSPESLMSISFQMSFSATIAVIATYEAVSRRRQRRIVSLRAERTWLVRVRETTATLFVVSLVAGVAITPFAAFYFQRVAPLSVIANMATGPAIDFVVMPMALLAVVLMPFGLEGVPLTIMKWGLAWMTAVAEKTADWTAGLGDVAMPPLAALLLMIAGFLWLALWRERWRLAGLAPVLIALPVALAAPHPVALVNEDGTAAAVRGADGRLSLIGAKTANFEKQLWLRADADDRDLTDPTLAVGVACDPLGCVAPLGADGAARLALANRTDSVEEDCQQAAVVVARFDVPANCARHGLTIDRRALALGGAHAVYVDGERYRVATAYPAERRPFMPPVRGLPAVPALDAEPTDRSTPGEGAPPGAASDQ
jgi:competence protein ComEC